MIELIIPALLLAFFLAIGTIQDLKTRRVKTWLYLVMGIAGLTYWGGIIQDFYLTGLLYASLTLIIGYFVVKHYKIFGYGDIKVLASAFLLFPHFYVITVSLLLGLVFNVIHNLNGKLTKESLKSALESEKEKPFIPYFLAGFLITCAFFFTLFFI